MGGSVWNHIPYWAVTDPVYQGMGTAARWLYQELWSHSDRWGQGLADERALTRLTNPAPDVNMMATLAEIEKAGLMQVYPDPSGRVTVPRLVYRLCGYGDNAPRDAVRNRRENKLAPAEDPGATSALSHLAGASGGVQTHPPTSGYIRQNPDASGRIRKTPADREPEKEKEKEKETAPPVPNESAVPRDGHQGSPSASPVPSGPPHEAGFAGNADAFSPDTSPDAPEPARVPNYTPHHEPPRGVRAARYDEEHLDRFSAAFGMEAKPPPEWPKGVPFLQPTEAENAHRLKLKAKYEAWLEEEARKAVPT